MMPNILDDVGVQVLKKDFLSNKRKGGKLDPRWLGPYIITQKFSKGFYSLQSVANPSACIKRVNGAHLKAFHYHEHLNKTQHCNDPSQSSSQRYPTPSSPRHSSQPSPIHSSQSSPQYRSSPITTALLNSKERQRPLIYFLSWVSYNCINSVWSYLVDEY